MEYEHENAIDQAIPFTPEVEYEMDMHTSILLDLIKSVTRIELKLDSMVMPAPPPVAPAMLGDFSNLLDGEIFTNINEHLDMIGF